MSLNESGRLWALCTSKLPTELSETQGREFLSPHEKIENRFGTVLFILRKYS